MAGDFVSIRFEKTGSGSTPAFHYYILAQGNAIIFLGSTGGESLAGFRTGGGAYINIQGRLSRSSDNGTGTPDPSFLSQGEQIMPCDGTLSLFYLGFGSTTSRDWEFTLLKNGVPTSIYAEIAAGGAQTNDLLSSSRS